MPSAPTIPRSARPLDPILAMATIEYSSIFGASEDKLREWFKDRVIVVGNRKSDNSDRYFHPDGRILPHPLAENDDRVRRSVGR